MSPAAAEGTSAAQTSSSASTANGDSSAAPAAAASGDIPPDSNAKSAAAPPTQQPPAFTGNAFPHFPSEQASRPPPPDAHASYAFPSSHTPSTVPNTPALSSVAYDSSVPGTPFEYAGSATQHVPNPALAIGTPMREMGHLSLAGTPDLTGSTNSVGSTGDGGLGARDSAAPREGGSGEVTGVGSDVKETLPAARDQQASLSPSAGAVESVLARTSAGQQALREGSLPSPKNLAIPLPGPAPSSTSVNSNGGVGTPGGGAPGGVPSNVATPGSTRAGTPADAVATPSAHSPREVHGKKEGAVDAPKRPTGPQQQSGSGQSQGSAAGSRSASNEAASTAPPPQRPAPQPVKEGKKSVFGKLFDRDRTASSASATSSHAGQSDSGRAAAQSGGGEEAPGRVSSSSQPGSQLETPPLARRVSGGSGAARKEEQKREEKERKERDKAERKDRERREKEEQREQKERLKAQRTPSQTGRSRSGSHGQHAGGNNKERDSSAAPSASGREKEGGGGGVMDFMRIKVQRKTSVTSRKSDDGKSEKSAHHAGGGGGGGGAGDRAAGDSQYGGSETKSRGGQSNASLNKKYGVCDKVIVGKGATAVVRLAHKWDRSTEKLYAVKVSLSSVDSRTLESSADAESPSGIPQATQERDGEGIRQEVDVRVLHLVDAAPVSDGRCRSPLRRTC